MKNNMCNFEDNNQCMKEIFAKDNISKLLSIDLPENREYVNVLNCDVNYSFNRAPSESHPDTSGKLVDESKGKVNSDEDWVGFVGNDNIEISVDFGKMVECLCGFSILALLDSANDRGVPLSFELYISDDGSDYKKVISTGLYDLPKGRSVRSISAYTEKGFSARYVKLVMSDISLNLVLVDAFRIYTCKEAADSLGDYYTNEPYYTALEESYWPETDDDYNTFQNLVLGKTPWFVEMDRIRGGAHPTDYYNTQTVGTTLSDGNLGEGDVHSSAYVHCTLGLGRNVIYDLGNLSSVSKFLISCKDEPGMGVTAPENSQISISENGKDWVLVAFAKWSEFVKNSGNLVYTKEFSVPFKARFVKFSLDVGLHVWIGECAVYGTKKVADNAINIADINEADATKDLINQYPPVDVLDGSENIFLAYNYATWCLADGRRSKEQYMHLVGYYNNENKLTDFFFDSFYFLPMVSTPSFFSARLGVCKQDFLNYIDDVFYKDRNAFALNEAVGEVKEALNKPDYKAFVYLPAFSVSPRQKDFGDVDGDGVTEDCENFEDFKKVAKWYIDTILKRFNDSELENLKLNGFCLYDEHIDADAHSHARIKFIADYIHSLGYKFFWIPSANTPGASSWRELGFDCVTMQPGYAFSGGSTFNRLATVADEAKYNGIGIELEISGIFGTDRQYIACIDYLFCGAVKGYMNTVKSYYADGVPSTYDRTFASADPKYRAVYDLTYLYTKNKLVLPDEDSIDILVKSFEVKAGETITGKYSLSVPYLTVSVKYGALHGMFTQNIKGDFKYTPDEGYVGYDKVTLTVKFGSFVTKDVTLLFKVG